MTINTYKTQFIFNRHKTISYPLMQIIMNNHSIGEVELTKFMGVIVNKHLNWYSYIQYIRNKVTTIANMIYYLTAWGGASKTLLNPLKAIQKKIIRAIFRLQTTDHTSDSFANLKL